MSVETPLATLAIVFAFVILVALSSRLDPPQKYEPPKVIGNSAWLNDPRLFPTRV